MLRIPIQHKHALGMSLTYEDTTMDLYIPQSDETVEYDEHELDQDFVLEPEQPLDFADNDYVEAYRFSDTLSLSKWW